MENIYYRYKPVVLPVTFLLVLLVLAIVSGSYFRGRVTSLQIDVDEAKDLNQKLESRLTSLQSVEQDVAALSEDAVFALPHKSSVILAVSHLRQQAEKDGLTFGQLSMRGSSQVEGELVSTNELYFEVEGEFASISNFLRSLASVVPIINLKSINLTSSGDLVLAEVTIVTFWSKLPDQLPAITESIAALSESEKEVLNEIRGYARPANVGINVAPEEPVERIDPFILEGELVSQ